MSFFGKLVQVKDFFYVLTSQLALNGKSLIAWLMNEIPGLTGYPGIADAIRTYLDNPSTKNLLGLIFQIVFALSSAHRLVKISKKVSIGEID